MTCLRWCVIIVTRRLLLAAVDGFALILDELPRHLCDDAHGAASWRGCGRHSKRRFSSARSRTTGTPARAMTYGMAKFRSERGGGSVAIGLAESCCANRGFADYSQCRLLKMR